MRNVAFLFVALVPVLLTGCITGPGAMTASKSTAAPPPLRPASDKTNAPYVMSANADGQCINFSITNNGREPLNVTPDSFAVIPKSSRKVMPYDAEAAMLDCSQQVMPGETVSGRAIFNELGNPIGSRLVFKPDARGTFAVIGAPRGAALSEPVLQ